MKTEILFEGGPLDGRSGTLENSRPRRLEFVNALNQKIVYRRTRRRDEAGRLIYKWVQE